MMIVRVFLVAKLLFQPLFVLEAGTQATKIYVKAIAVVLQLGTTTAIGFNLELFRLFHQKDVLMVTPQDLLALPRI